MKNTLQMLKNFKLNDELITKVGSVMGMIKMVNQAQKDSWKLINKEKEEIIIHISSCLLEPITVLGENWRRLFAERLPDIVFGAITWEESGIMFGTTSVVQIPLKEIKQCATNPIEFIEILNEKWKNLASIEKFWSSDGYKEDGVPFMFQLLEPEGT
ncbi:MAG: hypothetical protein WCO65_03875 [bacterium]